jgi:iron complex transport system permease protein
MDRAGTIQLFRAHAGRRLAVLAGLLALPLLAAVVSLATGASRYGLADFLDALARSGEARDILLGLRLPRTVMAVLTGCGLAVSGAVCQAVLRNPLASPFTLGVASGAGFGAVAAIILFGAVHNGPVAAGAFAGALGVSLLVLGLARLRDAAGETVILSGVALMYLFSALTSFLQTLGSAEDVHRTVFWFFGNLSKAGWPEAALAAAMILPPLPLLVLRAWDLNLLLHGDETAETLGVNVAGMRGGLVVLASLMTAGAICFTGVIGFIGLVAPHMARLLVGSDHRRLIPASAAVGAALVTGADIAGRSLLAPQVIPIGVVTAFLGVPFFFFLLFARRRRA